MLLADSLMQSIEQALTASLGGDAPEHPLALYQIVGRSVVVSVIGVAIVRVCKNRLMSRMTSIDVIFGILVSSLLSRGVTGQDSLSGTLVASLTVASFHWLLSFLCYHSHVLGRLVKGRETLIVHEGEPIQENLRRAHISEHDLEEELRLQGIDDIRRTHRVYQERNGDVSILKAPKPPTVLEISVQEGVQTVRIQVS